MAEEEETEPLGSVREKVVVKGATVNTQYEIGQIPVAGGASFSPTILVGEFDTQLLVCLPLSVWNRRVANRLLPSKGLSKPVACSMVACDEESREQAADGLEVQSWIGVLHSSLEEGITFDRDLDPDHNFGVGAHGENLVPVAHALAEVFNERYSFQTATSTAEAPGLPNGGTVGQNQDRVSQLEASMADMQANIQKLLSLNESRREPTRVPGVKTKPAVGFGTVSAPPGLGRQDYAGLDPQVVRAALDSGIPEQHLEEMSRLVQKHPMRMGDVPRSSAGMRQPTPLDESDEEEDIDGAPLEGEEEHGGAVEKAILQPRSAVPWRSLS